MRSLCLSLCLFVSLSPSLPLCLPLSSLRTFCTRGSSRTSSCANSIKSNRLLATEHAADDDAEEEEEEEDEDDPPPPPPTPPTPPPSPPSVSPLNLNRPAVSGARETTLATPTWVPPTPRRLSCVLTLPFTVRSVHSVNASRCKGVSGLISHVSCLSSQCEECHIVVYIQVIV